MRKRGREQPIRQQRWQKEVEVDVDHVDPTETPGSSEHHVEEPDPSAKQNETTDMLANEEPHEHLDIPHQDIPQDIYHSSPRGHLQLIYIHIRLRDKKQNKIAWMSYRGHVQSYDSRIGRIEVL